MRTTLPKVKRVGRKWYIPALPPHYEMDVGPYDHRNDAEEVRKGVEETINTPLWKMVIQDLEEEEEEFEREWKEKKRQVEEFEREWNSKKRTKNESSNSI